MRKNVSSGYVKTNEHSTKKNNFRFLKSNNNYIFVSKLDTERLYRHKKDLYDLARNYYPILH
jgi:hypothetical protein